MVHSWYIKYYSCGKIDFFDNVMFAAQLINKAVCYDNSNQIIWGFILTTASISISKIWIRPKYVCDDLRSVCCVCCSNLHKHSLWRRQRMYSLVTLAYNLVDNWLVFTIEISHNNNISLYNTMALLFMYLLIDWLRKLKDIQKSLWSDKEDKISHWVNILTDTAADPLLMSAAVAETQLSKATSLPYLVHWSYGITIPQTILT